MDQSTLDAADADLKARHRTMWAWGDYPRIAHEIVAPLGPVLVDAAGVGAGHRVLDVAAGTGNAAIAAARLAAEVVASDLTPELLDAGERDAREQGLALTWRAADAEALPFADAEFDVVISCIGVMFAPHHQTAADELTRVCRPGGTIGLLSWTPAGFIGQLFATMKPYAPPPSPGAQPPPLWGSAEHVGELLGDRAELREERTGLLPVDAFPTAEAFRDYFKAWYGPTIGVYRSLADDPERIASLDHDLAELARAHQGTDGSMGWEYLLLTARRT
jgi:ubiquinone/menaquinone biosynthesis C-methylase UbiE